MRPYLNEFINTLSSRRQERVSSLLENARVGKERLDQIAETLREGLDGMNVMVLRRDTPEALIDATTLSMNLRDVGLKLRNLYETSNLISLLLSGNVSLLASEIKNIEDELVMMEKLADNFGFLLADNQSFDFSYLEAFIDDLGRSENVTFIPDRTGNFFGPEHNATIRIDEGVLTLPETIANSHGMTARVEKTNTTSYVVLETDINNLLSQGSGFGWMVKAASPRPISSSLQEASGISGAQALLEFALTQPAPSSEIRLVPFAEHPVDVLQVTLYEDEVGQGTGVDLLDHPIMLDRPYSLSFPLQAIAGFKVLINQKTFERKSKVENQVEAKYYSQIRRINQREVERKSYYERRFNITKLERAVQSASLGRRFNFFSSRLPYTKLRADRGPLNPALMRLNRIHENTSSWKTSTSEKSRFVYEVPEAFGSTKFRDITRGQSDVVMAQLSKPASGTSDISSEFIVEHEKRHDVNLNFYYTLGLYSVSVGVDAPRFKGVFVSRALPSAGDIGEIRIKSDVENYTLPVSSRMSRVLTSVEFSVSHKSNPEEESDWIPILPVGRERSIIAERLFPNEFGVARLRFPAAANNTFFLYRNGYLMSSYEKLSDRPEEVIGVNIDERTITPNDIFTVDYIPINDHSTVSFENLGFDEIPLVSAFDSSGVGERFGETGPRNTVTLGNRPYIDPAESKQEGYSPITVILETGEVPQNVTNYRTRSLPDLPDEDYYYIHSGNTLLFNRRIERPFRVFYQYLQNNVRYRVILRCNSRDFVSPRVEYVQVKGKTRRPDQAQL